LSIYLADIVKIIVAAAVIKMKFNKRRSKTLNISPAYWLQDIDEHTNNRYQYQFKKKIKIKKNVR